MSGTFLDRTTFPASYIIYSGSGQYWAKSCIAGGSNYSGSDASTVIQNAISVISGSTNGGKIFIKSGTYGLTSTLVYNHVNGINTIIEGGGNVWLTGSIATMFDIGNTSWIGGDTYPILTLKNLNFRQAVANSTDICLDLTYGDVNLEDIRMENTGTYGGTGSIYGPKSGTAYTTWKNVVAIDYCTSFVIGVDFLTAINLSSIRPEHYAFYMTGSGYCNLVSPTIVARNNSSGSLFWAENLGTPWTISGVNLSFSTNFSGSIFSTGSAVSKAVDVYGINAWQVPTNSTFCNSYTAFRFQDRATTLYRTVNTGTFNLTTQSGSIAHGLITTPTVVTLTQSGSPSTLYYGILAWYPSGSTGFYIVQTGSGNVGGTWRAEV